MLTKYCSADVLEVQRGAKKASNIKLSSFEHLPEDAFREDDDYIYVKVRAISSQVNKNFDSWPAYELAGMDKSSFDQFVSKLDDTDKTSSRSVRVFTANAVDTRDGFGFKTFSGRPVFVDHNNSDPGRARGVVVDAVLHVEPSNKKEASDSYWASPEAESYHKPETWIELLMEIDAKQFPKLAAALESGEIDSVSMGASVQNTECNICANVAETQDDFCHHIANKGNVFFSQKEGRKKIAAEVCHDVSFFEISNVFDPADPTAVHTEPVKPRKIKKANVRKKLAGDVTRVNLRALSEGLKGALSSYRLQGEELDYWQKEIYNQLRAYSTQREKYSLSAEEYRTLANRVLSAYGANEDLSTNGLFSILDRELEGDPLDSIETLPTVDDVDWLADSGIRWSSVKTGISYPEFPGGAHNWSVEITLEKPVDEEQLDEWFPISATGTGPDGRELLFDVPVTVPPSRRQFDLYVAEILDAIKDLGGSILKTDIKFYDPNESPKLNVQDHDFLNDSGIRWSYVKTADDDFPSWYGLGVPSLLQAYADYSADLISYEDMQRIINDGRGKRVHPDGSQVGNSTPYENLNLYGSSPEKLKAFVDGLIEKYPAAFAGHEPEEPDYLKDIPVVREDRGQRSVEDIREDWGVGERDEQGRLKWTRVSSQKLGAYGLDEDDPSYKAKEDIVSSLWVITDQISGYNFEYALELLDDLRGKLEPYSDMIPDFAWYESEAEDIRNQLLMLTSLSHDQSEAEDPQLSSKLWDKVLAGTRDTYHLVDTFIDEVRDMVMVADFFPLDEVPIVREERPGEQASEIRDKYNVGERDESGRLKWTSYFKTSEGHEYYRGGKDLRGKILGMTEVLLEMVNHEEFENVSRQAQFLLMEIAYLINRDNEDELGDYTLLMPLVESASISVARGDVQAFHQAVQQIRDMIFLNKLRVERPNRQVEDIHRDYDVGERDDKGRLKWVTSADGSGRLKWTSLKSSGDASGEIYHRLYTLGDSMRRELQAGDFERAVSISKEIDSIQDQVQNADVGDDVRSMFHALPSLPNSDDIRPASARFLVRAVDRALGFEPIGEAWSVDHDERENEKRRWDIRNKHDVGQRDENGRLKWTHVPEIRWSHLKNADYNGWSNWDTWNTLLLAENEYESYQRIHSFVEKNDFEGLKKFLIEDIIGPTNAEAIEDAQEWNDIPEEERIDYHFEDLKERNPKAAELVDALGFGADVSDYQPDLIDAGLVNFDEIWKHLRSGDGFEDDEAPLTLPESWSTHEGSSKLKWSSLKTGMSRPDIEVVMSDYLVLWWEQLERGEVDRARKTSKSWKSLVLDLQREYLLKLTAPGGGSGREEADTLKYLESLDDEIISKTGWITNNLENDYARSMSNAILESAEEALPTGFNTLVDMFERNEISGEIASSRSQESFDSYGLKWENGHLIDKNDDFKVKPVGRGDYTTERVWGTDVGDPWDALEEVAPEFVSLVSEEYDMWEARGDNTVPPKEGRHKITFTYNGYVRKVPKDKEGLAAIREEMDFINNEMSASEPVPPARSYMDNDAVMVQEELTDIGEHEDSPASWDMEWVDIPQAGYDAGGQLRAFDAFASIKNPKAFDKALEILDSSLNGQNKQGKVSVILKQAAPQVHKDNLELLEEFDRTRNPLSAAFIIDDIARRKSVRGV